MSAGHGPANSYQVAFEGACNLPEYSQLPQFLPLNCQLINPIKLNDYVDTTATWLFGLDLARVDHVFAIVIPGSGSRSRPWPSSPASCSSCRSR